MYINEYDIANNQKLLDFSKIRGFSSVKIIEGDYNFFSAMAEFEKAGGGVEYHEVKIEAPSLNPVLCKTVQSPN